MHHSWSEIHDDAVNFQAAELMAELYDSLKANGYDGSALERLLVRLMFCFFADHTGIFTPKSQFRDWIEGTTRPDGSDLGARYTSARIAETALWVVDHQMNLELSLLPRRSQERSSTDG